jgi:peptidyl-prolyl cis-trans isomerase SurA
MTTMRIERRLSGRQAGLIFLLCGFAWTTGSRGQAAQDSQTPKTQTGGAAPAGVVVGQAAVPPGVELDRVVEVVNDDVILESDVDEDRRLAAFQPFRDASIFSSRAQIVDRLIDRTLILQQARLQLEDQVTDQQVNEQLAALRKEIPACKQYQCDTDAGWQKFVTDQGFTMEELRRRWRQRMEVLRFIEVRFRSGIHIEDNEIRDYYEKTLLPQYARQNATAPKLETISNRIQEVLLQQRVSNLLDDWLKSLRAQGTVRAIQQTEVTP